MRKYQRRRFPTRHAPVHAVKMDQAFTYGNQKNHLGRAGEWLIVTAHGIEFALPDDVFQAVYQLSLEQ